MRFCITLTSMSMTSVRLPDSLLGDLDRIAESRDLTRSELIREALEDYVVSTGPGSATTRGELVDGLVTYRGSGRADLAERTEQVLRERLGVSRRRSR